MDAALNTKCRHKILTRHKVNKNQDINKKDYSGLRVLIHSMALFFLNVMIVLSVSRSINAQPIDEAQPAPIFVLNWQAANVAVIERTLEQVHLVDSAGNWIGNDAALVLLGGLHQKPLNEKAHLNSTATLNSKTQSENLSRKYHWLRKLTTQAEKNGGRIVVILNKDDLQAIRQSPVSKMTDWLKEQKIILKVGRHIFTHLGISLTGLSKHEYLADIAAVELKKSSQAMPVDSSLKFTSSKHTQTILKQGSLEWLAQSKYSPVNYTGNQYCHPFFESDRLKQSLSRLEADVLWTTSLFAQKPYPMSRFDGQLKLIPSIQESQVIGKIVGEKIQFFADGAIISELSAPVRKTRFSFDLNDEMLESILKTAEVIEIGNTKEGRTKPWRVKLEFEGRIIEGLFKYQALKRSSSPAKSRKSAVDSLNNEVAAYKLDRMLGIGLVPVTVERTISGREGTLQLWIDDLHNVMTMRRENIEYDGHCDLTSQVHFMDVFDYLIGNEDRNQSNMMYGKSDHQIWFIDHSMAFPKSTKRPATMRKSKAKASDTFKAALRDLSKSQLQSLTPWLSQTQIDFIWRRREKILKGDF